jgi:hypothetical protein
LMAIGDYFIGDYYWLLMAILLFENFGFKWINNFQYNVGDCLFDARTYLFKYSISSKMIWKKKITYHLPIISWS